MAGKRWMTTAFAAMAIAVAASRAVGQGAANQPQPPPTSQPSVENYLDSLAKTVSEGTLAQRLDAAERLVECRQPRANALVTQLLSDSDNDRAQSATAHAISESTGPQSVWINSLAPLLNRDPATSEFAAKALAQYDTTPTAYNVALIQGLKLAPSADRVGIVSALGRVVQKQVAQALVAIIADAAQPLELRTAASEAMTQLSGQTPKGDTIAFWNGWLAARISLQPVDWRKTVIEEQHAGLQASELQARESLSQLRDRINKVESRRYNFEPAARKMALLLELLNDPNPDLRAAGAYVAADAIYGTQGLDKNVRSRLFDLVSDPSPEVRRNVSGALFNLVDANAFDPILLQLQVEPNLPIKLALIKALARTDNRAQKILENMIRQDAPVTAEAAADAIALPQAPFFPNAPQIQPEIDFLLKALQERTGQFGAPSKDADLIDLRAHLVSAIASLAAKAPRPETVKNLIDLAGPNESVAVRAKALVGLGSMGQAANDASDLLRQALNNDPDPAIRRAAATGLGSLGSFYYYDDLNSRTDPRNENSEEVRAAAKQACSRLLLVGTASETQGKAEDLDKNKEYDRARDAFIITCAKLAELKTDDAALSLAIDRKRVGELYLDNLGNPRDAIPYFRSALEYFQNRPVRIGQQNVESIIEGILRSYFQLDDIDAALKFAGEQLHDLTLQTTIGPLIRNRADELSRFPATAESKAKARRLIDAALGLYKSGKLNINLHDAEQLEFIASALPPAPTTSPAK